jgi:hypothetical protein
LRRRPCALLLLHLHQVVEGTFTPELSNMLGTPRKGPERSGPFVVYGPGAALTRETAAVFRASSAPSKFALSLSVCSNPCRAACSSSLLRVRKTQMVSKTQARPAASPPLHDQPRRRIAGDGGLPPDVRQSGVPNRNAPGAERVDVLRLVAGRGMHTGGDRTRQTRSDLRARCAPRP